MGWFGGKRKSKHAKQADGSRFEQAAAADAAEQEEDPTAWAARQFVVAMRRGSLDDASNALDRYLAEAEDGGKGVVAGPEGDSLLEHAVPARRALNAGDLDRAAEVLASWKIQPPNTSSHGPERLAQLPNLNTLGMLLIDFFCDPASKTHSRYDELLDGKLADVAKWTRLSSPTPKPGGFFDRAYASLKSERELARARERQRPAGDE